MDSIAPAGVCRHCKKPFPIDQLAAPRRTNGALTWVCDGCAIRPHQITPAEYRRAHDSNLQDKRKRIAHPEATEVRCTKCKQTLPRAEFAPDTRAVSGLQSWCRACMRDLHTSDKMKRRAQERHRETTYGLTQEQFDEMLASQSNGCAICGGPPVGKRGWHVDHDHGTGNVRAILCQPCNHMLGSARDNPETLIAAADYLKRYGK